MKSARKSIKMLQLDSSLRRATWSYYYETLVPKLQIQNVEQLLLHKKTDLFSISAICAYKVTNNFNTALSFLLETQRFNSQYLISYQGSLLAPFGTLIVSPFRDPIQSQPSINHVINCRVL